MKQLPKPGDKLSTWTGNPEDSESFVIKVMPYTGHYSDMFKYVIRFTTNTANGYMDVCVSGEAYTETDEQN